MSILLRGSTFGFIAGCGMYIYVASDLYKKSSDLVGDVNKIHYTIYPEAKPQVKYIEPKAEWNMKVTPNTDVPATRTLLETYNDGVRSLYKRVADKAY